MTIHNPGGQGYPITELYVCLVEHSPGNEGVAAVAMGDEWFPLIGSKDLVESFKELADALAKTGGVPIVLYQFTGREVVERFEP